MKKLIRIFSCFFLALMLFVPFNDALSWVKNSDGIQSSKNEAPILIAANSSSPSNQPDVYEQAETLFKEKRYDDVITLLSGPCYNNPTNVEFNILLAKAQVEKCAILKAKGNNSYKAIIKQPYITGRRLHKMFGPKPELYYIVAKSLLINNRINRARKTIKKALYYAPNNADYLIVLGDTYCVTAEKDKRRGEDPDCYNESYSKAKDAYEKAITIKNDDEFKTKVEKKIKKISEKMK